MNLLVTANELWLNFWGGINTFLEYPVVQSMGTWIDTGIVGIGAVIFFKYVLPKLRENEANKKLIIEMEDKFNKFVEVADASVIKLTGINLNLEEKVAKLGEAFNVAFMDSNIGIKAKGIINSILQSVITGAPINVSAAVQELANEGVSVTEDIVDAFKEAVDGVEESALSQLERDAETALNGETTGTTKEV